MAKKNKKTNMSYLEQQSASTKKDEGKSNSRWAKAQDRAQNRKANKQQQKNQQKSEKKKGGIKEYFRGVKLEMKKVVWPTRKELGSFTVIVLATCAAFALLFWGVDSGVLAAIKAVCFN